MISQVNLNQFQKIMKGLELSLLALQSEIFCSSLAHYLYLLEAWTQIFNFLESPENLVWRAVTPDYLNLYESMPRCMQAVVD